MFLPGQSGHPFSEDERREIAKAVVIASLSAVAAKLVEWGAEWVKTRVKARAEEQDGDGGV